MRYKVIGIGGAARNQLNELDSFAFDFNCAVNIDTDIAAASVFLGSFVQIGNELQQGRGSVEPEVGFMAAMESKTKIAELLSDTDFLILTAGLGGGCGTGALPYVAELARTRGIKTALVVTTPAGFEGERRRKRADDCLFKIAGSLCDDLFVIPIIFDDKGLLRIYENADKEVAKKIIYIINKEIVQI